MKKKSKFAEWLLKKSDHPAFAWIVFILTVCESVFLFIPPEVFMTPPIVANRRRAIPVIVAAAAGSLIGGIIAYMVGVWLFDSVGVWLINTFSNPQQFVAAQGMFARHGLLIIFLAAFTPVPYKLLALSAGFLDFPAVLFIGVSAIFRTMRFAIVGYLLWRFQEAANTIVKKYFWHLMIAALAVVAFGIWLMYII